MKQDNKSIFEKVAFVYLVLLASLFLLVADFGGYQKIQETKFAWFLFLCGGYIIVMLLLAMESLLIGAVKFMSPINMLKKATPVQICAVLYLLFTWLSALISSHFPQTIIGASRYEGALTITIYCICFLLVSKYGRATKQLLYIFAEATFLFSCLCIAQLHGYNPFLLYPQGYTYMDADSAYAGAYLGTIGNVDLVAAYYCLAIPILWLSFLRRRERARFLLLLPLLTSLYVLCKMFVLAGIVGILIGSAFSIPIIVCAPAKTKKIIAGGLVAFVALCLTVLYCFDIGSGFLHEVYAILHGETGDLFGSGRIRIWRLVCERIPEHLWCGTGPDTMAYANIEAFSRYDEDLGKLLVSSVDIAHNEYLNIFYHQGIFAMLSYLSVLICILVRWIQNRKDTVCAILGCAALCYMVQACFGFSMCITAPYFWVVIALLERRSVYIEKESKNG